MFISLEGPEGSGKSTQARELVSTLGRFGTVLLTREPGGTELGERLREALLLSGTDPAHPVTELLLFSAARAQLVHHVIQPALAKGMIVVCDRYADSTRAYQGGGLGLPKEQVEQAILLATGGLEPDLTLYLDIPAAEGLARRRGASNKSGDGWNEFDARELEFHERVRREYLRLADCYPNRIVAVDAGGSIEEVATRVRELVVGRLAHAGMLVMPT